MTSCVVISTGALAGSDKLGGASGMTSETSPLFLSDRSVKMVAIAIYYFAPFRVIGNKIQPNNSKRISELLFKNKIDDVTIIELPVTYNAIEQLLKTAPLFDLTVAVGEDESLKRHARYEKISELNGKTVVNPIKTKYIYQNNRYDSKNNFVCNHVNYHMISNISNCLFVHVPVSPHKNAEIAENIKRELVYIKNGLTHHTVMAEKLHPSQYEIGFEKLYTAPLHIGKLFTSKQKQKHTMTMQNTYIPLDILFLSKPIHGIRTVKKIETGIPRRSKSVVGVSFDVLEIPYPYCIVNNIRTGHTVFIVEV